jgi:hypothetical protein
VGLKNLQTVLVGCKKQLRNSNVTIKFEDIDYGFKQHLTFRQEWDSWSVGKRAGVGIGMTLACILGPILLIGACIAMCS